MDEKLIERWPDLHFGPINLFSAPWLGRRYVEWRRDFVPESRNAPFVPDERVAEMQRIISNR